MAKGDRKLTKLKSVLKKMKPFKLARSNAGNSSSSDDESTNYYAYNSSDDDKNNLHPVYVGKSRRRYLVGPDVVDHPLFQELVERSSGNSEDSITVGCEVVLFDHLLWMLENGDPQPPECLDELADFYAS